MLKCIPRSKQIGDDSTTHNNNNNPSSSSSSKSLTSQIKGGKEGEISHSSFRWSGWRSGSFNSVIGGSSRSFRKNNGGTAAVESSDHSRGLDSAVYVEECDAKEWDVHVQPGVLLTLVSLPPPAPANHLKRIRFSQDMFNKWEAQRWWAENYERVLELFNVKRCSHHAIPLPTTPKSQEVSKFYETGSSRESPGHPHRHQDSAPSLSTTVSCVKTENSSITSTTSSSREAGNSEEVSLDNEWVEEDVPGVFVAIRPLPNGRRELLRVRFSREQFGERRAREWWEENRRRIHEQYL